MFSRVVAIPCAGSAGSEVCQVGAVTQARKLVVCAGYCLTVPLNSGRLVYYNACCSDCFHFPRTFRGILMNLC